MIRTSRYLRSTSASAGTPIPRPRNGNALAVSKGKAGVRARQFAGGSPRHRTLEICRPFQHAVVVNDDDAVAREMQVELEAVGAERQAVVERRQGVFRGERAPSTVREDEGRRRREKGMQHKAGVRQLSGADQSTQRR